jgi:hypothetical protein
VNIKIEFLESKSPKFANILRLCKKIKSYQETIEEGIKVYSVEFGDSEFQSFLGIHEAVRTWKHVHFYVDGMLTSQAKINDIIYDRLYKKQADKEHRDYLFDNSMRMYIKCFYMAIQIYEQNPNLKKEMLDALLMNAFNEIRWQICRMGPVFEEAPSLPPNPDMSANVPAKSSGFFSRFIRKLIKK